jgi:hypothetical protein
MPTRGELPVDFLHWNLSAASIIALLIFLVPLRWRAPEAGPASMFVAAIVALLAFRTPWMTLAVAGAQGVWDAIFILYVIWPALLLYRVTKQVGAYDALRIGIARFSRNELFIILALSWVFPSLRSSCPSPTNVSLKVYGPGSYKFGDFWKLGIPVLIWTMIVTVVVTPLYWRF